MGFIISTIACVIALTLINKVGGKGERQLTKKTLIPLFFRGLAAAVVILIFCLVWNDDTFVTNLLGISNTSIVYLLIDNFLLTALVEEGFKYIALKTYLKKHDCIRCSHHAVVVATAVAAGFTAAENIFYLMGDVGVLLRIVFGITGHYAYAVYMGYKTTKDRTKAITDIKLMPMNGGYQIYNYDEIMAYMTSQASKTAATLKKAADDFTAQYQFLSSLSM